MKNWPILLALPLTLAPLLAACATPPKAPNYALIGSKWTFVSIDGVAPVSKKNSVTFDAGRLGANVGCNGMGGGWKLETGRLVVDRMMSTMMFCDGLMEQEGAVNRLLEGRPSLTFQGSRLILNSDNHSAELQRVE